MRGCVGQSPWNSAVPVPASCKHPEKGVAGERATILMMDETRQIGEPLASIFLISVESVACELAGHRSTWGVP